jgi:hypothetical protein
MDRSLPRAAFVALIALLLGACTATPSAVGNVSNVGHGATNRRTEPILITMNLRTGALESWPMQRGGGGHPTPLSGNLGLPVVAGLAANGNVIVIASQSPPEIVLYDVQAQTSRALPDPFGTPVDVAVGKDGSIYAINVARSGAPVTMYPAPSFKPVELICGLVSSGIAIAVDNESDIFIQGYGSGISTLVAEIPNGASGPDAQHCTRLPLKGSAGYVEGVAIDPKTDALLTLDNPDACAGGIEGRLTVYPKPYNRLTGRSRQVGVLCSGGLRLNADSTAVFVGDSSLDFGTSVILQRAYPGGGDLGIYHGGKPIGFTTIPNTLPN